MSVPLRALLARCQVPTRVAPVCGYCSASADDVIYTDEHWALRESIAKVIEKDVNPFVDKWEAEKRFPAKQLFKTLGSVGVFGVDRPTVKTANRQDPKYAEYGGLGLDFSYSVAVAEELGTIRCGGVPMGIAVQAWMATPALANFGSEHLRRNFLAPTIAGDMVTCLGVSESHAGSDVAATRTNAVREGDELIINGGKMWTTNGLQADWMCLLANTELEQPAHRSKSLICVPLDAKGITRSTNIAKLGMHSSDTCETFFDNVRVPANHIIGEPGMGFTYQMLQFQDERLVGTALALRPLELLIDGTIEYTKQRQVFGKSVLDNQVVHYRLAELQTEVEALRSLLYRATLQRRSGMDCTRLASMAKLKAGRLARETADACLQFWGGMGYTDECIASRVFRDMRLLSIGAGADEVMLAIICKYMGILPKQ